MNENKNIYASLNICQCQFHNGLPQPQKSFNDLGNFTSNFLNIYLPANSAFASAMFDKYYPSNKLFNTHTITLGVNYGVIAYLFKKAEGKSNERAAGEATFEFAMSYLGSKAGKKLITKTATKVGVSLGSRILAGATTGAVVGSSAPIVGTIIGAVAGALIAGVINDAIFADEDAQLAKDKAENEKLEKLEKEYKLKIDRINDYLIRNHYVELRELNEAESEELCKEASNPYSSYFKTIMLMQSFPNYLDRDAEFYESLQSQEKDSKEPQIQSIANAIPLTLEIEKCYDGVMGHPLINTTIYIYNHRFKRIVAKGKSDTEGKFIAHNVYVGKEATIDKISLVRDRSNFNEDNFALSLNQYESFTNIQDKHKKAKELKLPKAYFNFLKSKMSLKYEYEVSSLKVKIDKEKNTIELLPEHNLENRRFRFCIKYAYMTFDTDMNIDKTISNITIANRASRGLIKYGEWCKSYYPIQEKWKEQWKIK